MLTMGPDQISVSAPAGGRDSRVVGGPGDAQAVRAAAPVAGAPVGDDVVTVVRDPKHVLGKRFKIAGDKVEKQAAVSGSVVLARQYHVPNAEAFAELYAKAASDDHCALINASFPGIPINERFAIFSEKAFERRLKLRTREEQLGIHEATVDGQKLKVVGRFKENVRASSWQLLDRDVDEHTPREFAELDDDAWLETLEQLLPGVSRATLVRTGSVSARVLRDGVPVGKGNAHHWVQVADAQDAERTRLAFIARAVVCGLVWLKPRRSRKTGEVVGHVHATIVDASTWTPGRFVFCGKPAVSQGLEVAAPVIEVVNAQA